MISRQAKKLAPAREQLQTLTPAELTEVSGGYDWGGGGGGGDDGDWRRRCHRHDWGHRRRCWGRGWDVGIYFNSK